jgi:hypothetical protein
MLTWCISRQRILFVALKALGFTGVTPMGTGYIDIGALQSQASSGGSAPHAYVQ